MVKRDAEANLRHVPSLGAVGREAGHLAHRGDARDGVGDDAPEAQRLLVTFAVVGLGRFRERETIFSRM